MQSQKNLTQAKSVANEKEVRLLEIEQRSKRSKQSSVNKRTSVGSKKTNSKYYSRKNEENDEKQLEHISEEEENTKEVK